MCHRKPQIAELGDSDRLMEVDGVDSRASRFGQVVKEIRTRRDEEGHLWDEFPDSDVDEAPSDNEEEPTDSQPPSSPSPPHEESPPPSYRSDSTYDANTSPPVEEENIADPADGDSDHLRWHDIMVAAALSVNSRPDPVTGMSPTDTLAGPPQYSESPDAEPAVTEVTILARRVAAEYSSTLRDDSYNYGTEYDDMSPEELRWVFGDRGESLDADWPELPVMDTQTLPAQPAEAHLENEHSELPLKPQEDVVVDRDDKVTRRVNESLDQEMAFRAPESGRTWAQATATYPLSLPDLTEARQFLAELDEERATRAPEDGRAWPNTGTTQPEVDSAPPASTSNGLARDAPAETSQEAEFEYKLVPLSRPSPEPREEDELLVQSVVRLMGSTAAERCNTYVDHRGTLYMRVIPLPGNHYLSPEMHAAHTAALNEAITQRATELNCSPAVVASMMETALTPVGVRHRLGFADTEPRLLPGDAFHKRVACLDPEFDDARALPGFRAQALSRRVEHIASVKRPDSIPQVGLREQPSRRVEQIACLTAELEIGGCKAYYMLFDSGSNTDSLTHEFARSANCKVFRLDDQITLQLGCVGSKSKITYGAWAEVKFGGIEGHAYFDIVNLDRYDGILGTPFMIKHKLILDFHKHQIIFPNGHIIPGLTVMQDLSLVKTRAESAAPRPGPSRD
ncbi:hypothetical protein DFH06DRAFT_1336148 [Mycena polygramma]|nr:hypothetical protein DFH06DRAFT_1336148 [Mycena polygramma]